MVKITIDKPIPVVVQSSGQQAERHPRPHPAAGNPERAEVNEPHRSAYFMEDSVEFTRMPKASAFYLEVIIHQ